MPRKLLSRAIDIIESTLNYAGIDTICKHYQKDDFCELSFAADGKPLLAFKICVKRDRSGTWVHYETPFERGKIRAAREHMDWFVGRMCQMARRIGEYYAGNSNGQDD